jgi:hypothetical protein
MTTSKRISGSRRVPYMTQVPRGPSFFDITTEINCHKEGCRQELAEVAVKESPTGA